jgi:hypothetical protein
MVHRKLAAKHGLEYKPEPNFGQDADGYETEADWKKGPTGANDSKYKPYSYTLKSELRKGAFAGAAFRHKATGRIINTGFFHDLEQVPDFHTSTYDEGFVDHAGKFFTREEARQHLERPHQVLSEHLFPENPGQQSLKMRRPEEFAPNLKLSEPLEKMAQLSYDTPEFQNWFQGSKVSHPDGKPMTAYHGTSKDTDFSTFKIGQRGSWFTTDPHEASKYAQQNDSQKVKAVWGPKGVSYQDVNTTPRVMPVHLAIKNPYRMTDADLNAHQMAPNYAKFQAEHFNQLRSKGHDGVDFGNGVWVAFHPHQIKSIFNNAPTDHKHMLKAEADPNLESDHHAVARDMAGFKARLHNNFAAARFLVGGHPLPLDVMRRALYQHDGDDEAAALSAYGLEISDANRKAIQAVRQMSSLAKFEAPTVHSVAPVMATAEGVAQSIQRAIDAGEIEHVRFNGKHSAGTMVAKDPEAGERLLIKPGSGSISSAAGESEEKANQSRREVAFWHVANIWGLGDWLPRAELVQVDGLEVAALHMLPADWKNLDTVQRQDPNFVLKHLETLRAEGILHRWAVLDFVLGNTDRHGANAMMGPDGQIRLIDHGSSMASFGFDPGHDENSFVPYYLRAKVALGSFKAMSLEDKLRHMPTLSPKTEEVVWDWVQRLDPARLAAVLKEYGIDPTPAVGRLWRVKQLPRPLDRSINQLWVTE